MPTRLAFLVEDNPTIRDNLIPTLAEMADVKVIAIAEGQREALKWLHLNSGRIDLVILDLFLTEGSGIGVLCELVESELSTPIVVLTNYATQDIRERCLALGAAALFDKSRELDSFLAFCSDCGSANVETQAHHN